MGRTRRSPPAEKRRDRPAHLSPELAAIWDEVLPTLVAETPAVIVETIVSQTKSMRDARFLIERDGAVISDAKNNAVEHPALGIERAAIKLLDDLNKTWAA